MWVTAYNGYSNMTISYKFSFSYIIKCPKFLYDTMTKGTSENLNTINTMYLLVRNYKIVHIHWALMC